MKIQAINFGINKRSVGQNSAQSNFKATPLMKNDSFEFASSKNVSFAGNPADKAAKAVAKAFKNINGLMCDESGSVYTGIIKKANSNSEHKAGKLVREEFNSQDRNIVYSYDPKGRVSSIEQFDKRGVLLSSNDYVRDDAGKIVRSSFYED